MVCVCVGVGGSFKGVPHYLFSPLHCLITLYRQKNKHEKSLLPFLSLPHLTTTGPHGFLPLHLLLPVFIRLFFSSPQHFLHILWSVSFSLFFYKNEKYHSLLVLRKAYNSVGSFPVDSPDKYTHTGSFYRRYLKSHCAHKDKPQQPEHHKASDKVQSPKFATVEIEFTPKNIQREIVRVSVLNHVCL